MSENLIPLIKLQETDNWPLVVPEYKTAENGNAYVLDLTDWPDDDMNYNIVIGDVEIVGEKMVDIAELIRVKVNGSYSSLHLTVNTKKRFVLVDRHGDAYIRESDYEEYFDSDD